MTEPKTPADVVLKPGRDRSVRRRHPWLLAGSVERVEGEPAPGAFVRVLSADGETLGFGHFAPDSRLRVRLLSFGKEAPEEGVIGARIDAAVSRRREDPALASTDAVRLVNAEGDGLPGLIVDRYADVVVVRPGSVGMAVRVDAVAQALRPATGASAGVLRADAAAARREGFAARSGPLWGDAPEAPVWIREGERRYAVDVSAGQKTGFYLDQRDARNRVQALARGRRVLDLFCYTGGFAVAAARGGARELTLVDSSEPARALARENLAANRPPDGAPDAQVVKADAFRYLRDGGEPYDLVVIDPPPLARSRRDVDKAARAYKDLLMSGLRRAAPGGHLLAFACSHHVGPELFRKIAFGASLDAGRTAQVLATLEAPTDHPVSIDHLEGRYLTGLLLGT
ncbi:MAG: class I SAM-dependent rRNA methyltransferase [Myxococcota bacterium]